jgi:hypothetical protein
VIIDGFETQMLNEEKQFSDSMFQIFLKEWSIYDHDADYFIEYRVSAISFSHSPITNSFDLTGPLHLSQDLLKMLKSILVPLGFNPHYLRFNEGEKELMNFVKSLKLRDYDGFVFFQDVAKALAHRKYEERLKKVAKPEAIEKMLTVPDSMAIDWPQGEHTAEYEARDMGFSLEERWAANVIQNAIRIRTARRLVAEKKRLKIHQSSGSSDDSERAHSALLKQESTHEAAAALFGRPNRGGSPNGGSPAGSSAGAAAADPRSTSPPDVVLAPLVPPPVVGL